MITKNTKLFAERYIINGDDATIYDTYLGKYVNQSLTKKTGYLVVNLKIGLMYKIFAVHQLIASLFLTKNEVTDEVNHINKVRTDNSINNLEYVTAKENTRHKFIGTEKEVKYYEVLRLLQQGVKTQDITTITGVTKQQIYRYKTGQCFSYLNRGQY